MSTAAPAIELLPHPAGGRTFTMTTKVRLGDVDGKGRLGLDGTARFLQDAATDDASDAGLDRRFGWLVRRTKVVTARPASLGEVVEVTTWCTGIGRAWAERRSQIVGDRGALVDAVALWVQVDVATGRPARVAEDFSAAYAEAAAGRSVSARLSIDPPTSSDRSPLWSPRRTDIDPFGHVNNAATWSFVEEYVDLGERRGTAELEYLAPIRHGEAHGVLIRRDEFVTAALVAESGGVVAAARWSPAS
ncbi:MAG: acyl-ACP thioesterase domain-containing protein [Ilumatobacter sp.]|uniref:acyl-[acyl-carrier-protein] thioesterase n=1 Tax=Ilumatobacter sp. TaxID=1967498 RepID=UPI0032997182